MSLEDETRACLAAALPRRDAHTKISTLGAGGYDLDAGRRYLAATVALGLAVPTWPVEHGGRGAGPIEAAFIKQVHEEFAIPDLYPFRVGLHMVGPTLLEQGTLDQRRQWLRAIAAGDHIWCQLFSEPDAGSDLANVSTMAGHAGADWVLDGQKVWTSRGAYADWGICLARHNPDLPKHEGLTMFAVKMDSTGVEVRPLRQMNGDTHFSQVYLSEVLVSDAHRIGAVGDGWRVALTLLGHERAAADRGAPRAVGDDSLPTWLAALSSSGRLRDDPVLRQRALDLYGYEEYIRVTQRRRTDATAGSGLKLHGAASFKSRAELMVDAQGARGMLADGDATIDLLTAPSMSIRGGTDEIQRNVIAERVLGLPAEPRLDRDISWSESRRGKTKRG